MSRRAPRCPDCAEHPAGVPVVYGLPDIELFEEANRGKVVLGGCLMPDPWTSRWVCPACKLDLGWGEPHPTAPWAPVLDPAPAGQLRVGTWNLERSPHFWSAKGDEVTRWQAYLGADIWLLTEVHEEWGYGRGPWEDGGSWAVSSPRGDALEDHRRWAGIQSRFPMTQLDAGWFDDDPARESLCLTRVELPGEFDVRTVLVACSVLPWRGAARYWPGLRGVKLDDWQEQVLAGHVAAIAEARDGAEPIIWGGDFNQELVPLPRERMRAGYRLAGTTPGIDRLRAAFEEFGLRPVTERAEHLLLGSPTIDHLAISEPFAAGEARVHRPHYADSRLLSDHAAYVAEVDLQPAALLLP